MAITIENKFTFTERDWYEYCTARWKQEQGHTSVYRSLWRLLVWSALVSACALFVLILLLIRGKPVNFPNLETAITVFVVFAAALSAFPLSLRLWQSKRTPTWDVEPYRSSAMEVFERLQNGENLGEIERKFVGLQKRPRKSPPKKITGRPFGVGFSACIADDGIWYGEDDKVFLQKFWVSWHMFETENLLCLALSEIDSSRTVVILKKSAFESLEDYKGVYRFLQARNRLKEITLAECLPPDWETCQRTQALVAEQAVVEAKMAAAEEAALLAEQAAIEAKKTAEEAAALARKVALPAEDSVAEKATEPPDLFDEDFLAALFEDGLAPNRGDGR